jgi:ferredoxin
VVSHKPVAVVAGLGHMGIHRNLIHPTYGNFVLLGTVLLDRAVPALATRRAHICGPPAMMDAVTLRGLGVPEAHIRTEAFGTVKRDPTARVATSQEVAGTVVFRPSDTTAAVPVGATILDVADEAGVFIDNACRSGTCGSCRVKLVSGRVTMAVQDALTEEDKAGGYSLACQAHIQSDVTVEA